MKIIHVANPVIEPNGDVHSDTVAQNSGSLGLMTSVLMAPDGKTIEGVAAHDIVTRHYHEHFDNNPKLVEFSLAKEDVCVKTVEDGKMTKDLALIVHGKDLKPKHYLNTENFLNALDEGLKAKLS